MLCPKCGKNHNKYTTAFACNREEISIYNCLIVRGEDIPEWARLAFNKAKSYLNQFEQKIEIKE